MKKFLGCLLFLGVITTHVFANNDIANTTWSLTTYNGSTATGTLSFNETMMFSKFCNNVSQGYSLSGTTLTSVGQAMSTMMYCEGTAMTLENNFGISTTGTSLVLSGDTLTIMSNNNSYSFTKNLVKLTDLSSTCIQAFDECGNMCHRAAGATDWLCTKMACSTAKDVQCIMSTNDEPVLCTMEYNPVCASKQVQCITTPCNPIQQTYSNTCMMNADKATLAYTGACEDSIVGNDKDDHGCILSAGYSWSQSKNECVRVWEYQATDLEKAYDLAYNHGITTMNTMKKFRANDSVTRQEAAKMLNAMAENLLGKKYASFPEECNVNYKDDSLFDPSLKNHIYGACAFGFMKGSQGKFMPHGNLTRGQALAILMRAVDGWQESEKNTQPRWMPYADRADQLGYMTFANFKGFEDAITRGELIEWIHIISQKKSQ